MSSAKITAVPTKQRAQVGTLSARWHHALALGCYALLAIIVTYPLILNLDSKIIANEFGAVDGYLGIWNIWWAAQALQNGQDPFVTPLLFYPKGLDLFWQTLSLPQGVLAFPLTVTLGPLPAYNTLILTSFILGGYTAFLFARFVVGNNLAALVAGGIYSLAPFHMQKVVDAQLEVASIQWVPCYLLVLHILLERRRWYWAILAGLVLLWVGLGTWYYGLFCLVYTGLAAGIWAVQPSNRDDIVTSPRHFSAIRRWLDIPTLLWGLVPIAIWLVLMTPRLISLIQTGDTYLGDSREFNARSSADIISFWLPNPLHPLWGEAISNFYLSLHPSAMLWNVAFGLVGIALAGLGIARTWRTNWRWIVLLGTTMILAMGEHLQAFGIETSIPLPYALLADLPGIRSSHRPNHFVILSILLVALLAAYGTVGLFKRWPRQRGLLTGGLLLAILVIDGWAAPLPLFSRPIPAQYANLPAPDGGAIFPIPVNLNFSRSENLWYQTAHNWPIIGGFIGREPPYPLGRYGPGFRELRYGRSIADDIVTPGWPQSARAALAAYNIRYVVYHPDAMGDSLPRMRTLMDELDFDSIHADPSIEIYPVPPVTNPAPLLYLGRGWERVEGDGEDIWRWMGDAAEVHLFNPRSEPQVVTLALHVESFDRSRPLSLRLADMPIGTIDISRAAMRRDVSFLLNPGEHVLYLSAPADPAPGDQSRQLSLAFLGIELRSADTATQ